jgi:hypothetical protein
MYASQRSSFFARPSSHIQDALDAGDLARLPSEETHAGLVEEEAAVDHGTPLT